MASIPTNLDFNLEGKDYKVLDTYILIKYDLYEYKYNIYLQAVFKQDFEKQSLKNFKGILLLYLDNLII